MTTRPDIADTGDAGFTLVEVLVALVIFGSVIVAIGGLISFAGSLRERTAQSDRIASALQRLESLRSALIESVGSPFDMALGDVAPREFDLVSTLSQPSLPVRVSLLDRAGESAPMVRLTYISDVGGQSTSVDLSEFDRASLDYLIESNGTAAWASTGSGSDFVAARLTLTRAQWIWTILLWVSPRPCLQSNQGCFAT